VETALHQLVVRVEKAVDQQEIALGVFLDIEGAFNNTTYESMWAALAKHGVHYTIIRWIRATTKGRLATATRSGLSGSVAVSTGCPQGGVLSTLLWCLIVNDLLARLSAESVYTQGNADDIRCLAVGKFSNMLSGLIQWALHTLETWWKSSVCRLIPTRLGLLHSREEGNFQGYLNHDSLGRPYTALCRSSILE